MKVRSVDNTIINSVNNYNNRGVSKNNLQMNNKLSSTPSFKGTDPTTCLIDIWAAIARGGLAASFTIQDMLGTNFPRTFAALDRNKDITGKNNYKASIEVAIREFTTGPSMFIIPALILAAASKHSGEANKVPVENIAAFSNIMKGTIDNLNNNEFSKINFNNLSPKEANDACLTIKKAFYKDAFTSIFEQCNEKGGNIDIDKYVDLMLKAENPNTPKRNFFMSMFNKKVKVLGKEVDSKDEIISKLASEFAADKKANTKGWGNFLSAKVTNGGREWQITNIVDDLKNFSNDFSKQYVTAKRTLAPMDKRMLTNKFINNFKDSRTGTRFITNVAMVIGTGLFMCFIPKLYTRNKTNPETDAIYQQVNQQRKGAVNGSK